MGFQPTYRFTAGREELYDLSTDSFESLNLEKTHPEVLKRFRVLLQSKRGEALALDPGESELSEDTLMVLKTLGYIQ